MNMKCMIGVCMCLFDFYKQKRASMYMERHLNNLLSDQSQSLYWYMIIRTFTPVFGFSHITAVVYACR